jgi:hypothetical protein
MSPTITPSSTPTDFDLEEQIIAQVGVTMVLGQTYPMNDEERGSWVKLTADVIDKEVQKVLGKEQVASLKVKVTLQWINLRLSQPHCQ